MSTRISFGVLHLSFGLLLISAIPLWSQVQPDASGTGSDSEFQMSMPTQVSGQTYSAGFGDQERANYLSLGLNFTAAYDDNILLSSASGGTQPQSETSFAVFPSIDYSQKTARQVTSLTYSAGFTFFTPTSEFNQINQNATLDYRYRVTRHSEFSVQDSFQQNSSILNQPYTYAGTSVSGSTIAQPGVLVIPYANQLLNSLRAEYGYQVSRDAMMGVSGSYQIFHYPDAGTQGLYSNLYNSQSGNGVGFYTRRLSRAQYIGVLYQYTHVVTNPVETTTNSQVPSLFYSIDLNKRFSINLTAGPQFVNSQGQELVNGELVEAPKTSSVSAYVLAGLSWTGKRTYLAGSYAHYRFAGQGLLGVYNSDSFNASGGWQFERRWSLNFNGSYSNFSNEISSGVSTTPGGHTIFGGASIQHQLNEHISVEADYRRLNQSYGQITAISQNPDDNRVSVSISCHLTRPVGR